MHNESAPKRSCTVSQPLRGQPSDKQICRPIAHFNSQIRIMYTLISPFSLDKKNNSTRAMPGVAYAYIINTVITTIIIIIKSSSSGVCCGKIGN